jgi:hypothetical protein
MDNGSKLKPFTFPDGGGAVRVKRIPPMLIRDLQRQFKPPKPPRQEVQFEKGVRTIPNPEHPDHVEAMAAYDEEFGERIMHLVVKLGVACEVDQAAVADLRAQMQEEGLTLDPDDKYVYVTRILAETTGDMEALQQAVLGESTVTEAGVAEATERFRPEVSGD